MMKLAVEANGVIALRMTKLMLGGRSARREAELMVSEKILAAFEAAASLVAGASSGDIVHRYRQHVAANARRLGSPKLGLGCCRWSLGRGNLAARFNRGTGVFRGGSDTT